MLCEEVVGAGAVDFVAALEEIGLEQIGGAERPPGLAGAGDGAFHGVDGKDVIACGVFDEAGARGDEAGEVAEFAELKQTGHEVTGAVIGGEDAAGPVAEVAADDGGFDAGVERGGEEGVHAAAADAHDTDVFGIGFPEGLDVIEHAHGVEGAEADGVMGLLSVGMGLKRGSGRWVWGMEVPWGRGTGEPAIPSRALQLTSGGAIHRPRRG